VVDPEVSSPDEVVEPLVVDPDVLPPDEVVDPLVVDPDVLPLDEVDEVHKPEELPELVVGKPPEVEDVDVVDPPDDVDDPEVDDVVGGGITGGSTEALIVNNALMKLIR